jgi:hypothetical protein
VLQVTGQAGFTLRCGFYMIAVLPLAFYGGAAAAGAVGVAAAWLVAYPLCLQPVYRRVFATLEMSAIDYLARLWPAARAAAAMAAVVLAVRLVLPADGAVPVRLAVEVLAGATCYLAVVAVTHGDRVLRVGALLVRERA